MIKTSVLYLLLMNNFSFLSDNPIRDIINSICLENEKLSYLKEVSTYNEFVGGEFKVLKWTSDIKISVSGNYTDSDIKEINNIIN